MTNEEAIAILERKTTIPGDGYTWEQIEEAINVAVVALKANQAGSEPLTLEQLREMNGKPAWVNADEQLPEKQKDVLMLFDTGNMAVGFWHDGDESLTFWCAYTDDGFYTDCDAMPTHWMPLPKPPAELEKRLRG